MLEGQHNFFFGYADGQEFFRHPFFNPIDLHPTVAIMKANLERRVPNAPLYPSSPTDTAAALMA